jgi:hypothetical protein
LFMLAIISFGLLLIPWHLPFLLWKRKSCLTRLELGWTYTNREGFRFTRYGMEVMSTQNLISHGKSILPPFHIYIYIYIYNFLLLLFYFFSGFLVSNGFILVFIVVCIFLKKNYNKINKYFRDRVLQHIINSELKGTCLHGYDEIFNKEKEVCENIKVSSISHFFIFGLDVFFFFYCWILNIFLVCRP